MDNKRWIKQFMDKCSIDDILSYLDDIKDLRILCIGESIIDEYQYGRTLGKSGKAPIVAFKNENVERYDGGILAIYNHLSDFCDVDVLTGWNRIVKRRYIQNGQKLFETYSTENTPWIDESDDIDKYDLVVVADFGHGFIDNDLRERITNNANSIALNCQLNAGNMGMNTINKYEMATYICVSENELRLAFSNQFDDLKEIIRENIEDDIVVAITQGNNGCLLYKNGEFVYVPAFVNISNDSIGAGDAFLAITSPLVCIDAPLDVIGFIGNCVGAITCGWPGNSKYVTKDELIEYIEDI